MPADDVSLERLRLACATLSEAFRLVMADRFAGAAGGPDPLGALAEAKRNLTALVLELHGREAWLRFQGED